MLLLLLLLLLLLFFVFVFVFVVVVEIHFKSIDEATLKLIVRAEIRKEYSPLIGAKVEVQVGSLPWKLLNDDGLGKLPLIVVQQLHRRAPLHQKSILPFYNIRLAIPI